MYFIGSEQATATWPSKDSVANGTLGPNDGRGEVEIKTSDEDEDEDEAVGDNDENAR